MKSCQTRIPSSSQRSWNAADSYAAVPGMRTMFMPAARSARAARAQRRRRRRRAARLERRPDRAARRTPRSPLTRSCEPVGLEPLAAGRARESRPVRRRSRVLAPPARRDQRDRVEASGSPWVCGHQQRDVADDRPRRAARAPSARRRRARALPRHGPAGAVELDEQPLGRRRSQRRAAGGDGEHAGAADDARPQLELRHDERAPALEAHRAPRPDHGRARARSPGRARAASCERSAGRRRATRRVRQRARGRRLTREQRRRAPGSRSRARCPRRAARRRRPPRRANIESLSRIRSPLR